MTRLDKWAEEATTVGLITLGRPIEWGPKRPQAGVSDQEDSDTDKVVGQTMSKLFTMAKEIIFDINADGKFTLTPMTWLLNGDAMEYQLAGVIEGRFDTEDEVKPRLVRALIDEVPVVPNTADVAPRLEAIFADLFANGFRTEVDGSMRAFALTDKVRFDPLSDTPPQRLLIQPAEISSLAARLREERDQNSQAKAVLGRLTAASSELSQLLKETTRNEHDLQRCLTRYPVLFGPIYQRVLPKHRLGSEYEVDYALEHVDGSIDVVEIEASTHKLYKKSGDPSAALTHAEQQVLDWLAWLDEHSPYARSNLPNVRRACGIVVIGRRDTLSSAEVEKLRWRNILYGGRMSLLTFEDLLGRCESLKRLLASEQS